MVRRKMMINFRKVFGDTSAWIALINSSDYLAARAKKIMIGLNQQQIILVRTEFALLEVADALCKTHLRQKTYAYINEIKKAPLVCWLGLWDYFRMMWVGLVGGDRFCGEMGNNWGYRKVPALKNAKINFSTIFNICPFFGDTVDV